MEIKNCTLTFAKVEQKTSAAGKPYTAMSIKIQGEDDFRNAFVGKYDMNLASSLTAGSTVDLMLFEEEYNGKMYKKFKFPSESDKLAVRVTKLESEMQFVLKKLVSPVTPATPAETDDFINSLN